ncbi:hypothetical protein [Isoptericola cucumis]|uniref:Uncharacterized protein n=1 Tax=Isoptericola cucumis TaxID=1776856 RepID=A0ABQ2BA45_9MICO|nr:hypothetical protein [Isoptericola cucumis]GGI10569.1 hypothetical protein GCM10007368_31890 [Isoptericola cucumis]
MDLNQIHRDSGDTLTNQLRAALDASHAGSLVWYLRELELVGKGIRGLTILELEDEVARSPHGLQVSWDELIELMGTADDIHDLVATGHLAPTEATIDPATGDYSGCPAVVEIFDSGTFRVGWDAEAAAGS